MTSRTCRITRARSEDKHDLERMDYVGPNATPLKPGDQTQGRRSSRQSSGLNLGLHVNSEDDEQLANVLNNTTGLRSQETGQATGVAI